MRTLLGIEEIRRGWLCNEYSNFILISDVTLVSEYLGIGFIFTQSLWQISRLWELINTIKKRLPGEEK